MVTISVVMPVFNTQERYLRQSIESILCQTFSDFEFIIIDDGSTINVKDIVLSYNDKRIKYIYQKKAGIVSALNNGLEHAVGKYIARMDSDDISLPHRFEKQVFTMEKNKSIGLCGTCVEEFIDETGEIVSLFSPFNRNPKIVDILVKPIICHPTAMFRTSVMKKNNIKYSNEYLYAEDQDIWRKMLQHSKAYVIQEKLLRYRRHSTSASSVNAEIGFANYNKVKIEIIQNLYPNIKITQDNLNEIIQQIINKNSLIENIFSVKNRDMHKIITIFGIKIKLKSKKLIEKNKWNNLNNKLYEQDQKYKELNNILNTRDKNIDIIVDNLNNKFDTLEKRISAILTNVLDKRQTKFKILKDEYNLIMREGTSDISVFYQVFVDENYNYKYKKEPKIILDIGANVGYTSIYYTKRFPNAKIYCLESDLDNYNILLKNVEKYKNIIPCNGALYSHDTILNIYDPNLGAWGLQVSETTNNTNKTVQAYSFKSLLKIWNLENKKIDILKIDIEGSEKELFENDTEFLDNVDLMIIETHDRYKQGTSQALFNVMKDKNFILNVKGEDLIFERNNIL